MEPDLDASGVGRGFLRRFFRWAGVPEVSSQREATVLAVASGKGGTGKSFP
ncbi:MAG: Mrp/NBP35 family ATP-binding protein, partial [Planctomycetes bacterium]|nr:Mrp/NBP35 family ATP-binding protein [Planctomycetota bacterium]